MFGPHDTASSNSAQSTAWKIKRQSNDELRQQFIDMTVKQADFLELVIPDTDLRWSEERGHFDIGPIDFEELMRVVSGDGPCNRERLGARVKAHEDGRWVREAAMAHAAKQRSRAKAA
ncbi:MAG: phenylacetate-CoA oxygenase subunit PaaI, partial [Alphaproteobacteria bacterium]|nr:phenylacetate-CoA oxygenase subunit PaaI [Alphaproteobacteria bacterium]